MPYFQNSLCVIPKKAPSVGGMLVFVTERVVASIFSVIFHFLHPFPKPDVIASFTFCSPSICSSLLVYFFLSTFRAFSDTPESSSVLVLLLSLGSFRRDKHNTTHAHTTHNYSLHLSAPPEVTRSRLSQSHAGDLQRFKCHIVLLTAVSVVWKHRGWSRGHWFLLLFKVHGTFTPGGSFDIPALNVLPESWIIDEWVPAQRTLRVFQNLTLFYPATLLNVIGVLYTSSQLDMGGWMERDEMIEGLGHSSAHRFASPREWILEIAVQT